jgi:hypothetical protein
MGSGGLFFDFDDDGWIDIFIVDGGSVADPRSRQLPDIVCTAIDTTEQFEDVTAQSGIRHREYGMGACAGDYDNDGLVDLYVTNYGPNTLYRNMGHGRFTEVANAGGAGTALWSTSCAFTDVDRDGFLDLFVTNYVKAEKPTTSSAGKRSPVMLRGYCHPLAYDPLPNVLYRNTGKGTFVDMSAKAGIAGFRGNGLGVAVTDVNDDGWPDVFVANDGHAELSLSQQRKRSIRGGRAPSPASRWLPTPSHAPVWVPAFGDYDGDGRLDLVVTNHEFEMHSLFRNLGDGVFTDVTLESGIRTADAALCGIRRRVLDYDNDGRRDLAIVNGNVVDNIAEFRKGAKHAQPSLLLRNMGDRFRSIGGQAGPAFAAENGEPRPRKG